MANQIVFCHQLCVLFIYIYICVCVCDSTTHFVCSYIWYWSTCTTHAQWCECHTVRRDHVAFNWTACVYFISFFWLNLEVVCYRYKALIWVTKAKHKVPLLSSSPPHEDVPDTVYHHAFLTSMSYGAQCSDLCCSCFTPSTAQCIRGWTEPQFSVRPACSPVLMYELSQLCKSLNYLLLVAVSLCGWWYQVLVVPQPLEGCSSLRTQTYGSLQAHRSRRYDSIAGCWEGWAEGSAAPSARFLHWIAAAAAGNMKLV